MSISPDEQTDSAGGTGGRFRLSLRVLAAVASLLGLWLLWSSERIRVAHDLQLFAEAVARPGEVIALRALVLRDVDAPQGPTLARLPVRVELVDRRDRVLAQTLLAPRESDGMEGEIAIPPNVRGAVYLKARAELEDGLPLRCERALEVSAQAPTLAARPREAGPLQLLAVGATRELKLGEAPVPFLPRVVGGACLPEQRCTLIVWVGEPASQVSALASPEVSVPSASAVPETSGLAAIDVVPHGMEASVTLEARRGGEAVAQRSVRLPIALGEVGVYVRAPLLEPEAPAQLSLVLPPGREHAIVDVFREGRWRASQTFAHAERGPFALSAGLIPTGAPVRVQARVDRFSSEGAGARMFFRREPGLTPAQSLSQLAGRVAALTRTPETAGWARTLPAFALDDPQRSTAFLLAPLELLRVPLPDAVSGRPERLAHLERSKTLLRFGVAAMLVLAALIVGASLMQRGLSAADEASAILEQARATEGGASDRLGARVRVILLVLAVGLAFLAGALLIVAKPLWF